MDREGVSSNNLKGEFNRCCICGKALDDKESVIEERPTGESWNLENWLYCLDCWLGMKKLREKELDSSMLLRVLDL